METLNNASDLDILTIISKNSQTWGIKPVCWINNYNEHDTTAFLSDYNE